jgi:hypothetical protein
LQRAGQERKKGGGKKKIEVKLEGMGKKSKNGVEQPRDFPNLQRGTAVERGPVRRGKRDGGKKKIEVKLEGKGKKSKKRG